MEILPDRTGVDASPVKVVVRVDSDTDSSASEVEVRATKKLTWRRKKDKDKGRDNFEESRGSLTFKNDTTKSKSFRLKHKKKPDKPKQQKEDPSAQSVDSLEPDFLDTLEDSWDEIEAEVGEDDGAWAQEEGENKSEKPLVALQRWKSSGWYMDEMADALNPKAQDKTAKRKSQRRSDGPIVPSRTSPMSSSSNRRSNLRQPTAKLGKAELSRGDSLRMSEEEAEAMSQAIAQMRHANSEAVRQGDKVEPKRTSTKTAGKDVSIAMSRMNSLGGVGVGGGGGEGARVSFSSQREVGSFVKGTTEKLGKPRSTWTVFKKAAFGTSETYGHKGTRNSSILKGTRYAADSDDSASDSSAETNAPYERPPRLTERLPMPRMRIDNDSWVYRRFSKVVVKWEKLKMKNLNPIRRDFYGSGAHMGDAGQATEQTVPINIQLVQFGDYELHTEKTTELVTPSRPKRTLQDFEGKQVCFQLLNTEDRLREDEGQWMSHIFCMVLGDRDKKFTTQTKPNAQVLEWGETFVFHAQELLSGGWKVLVQVWGSQSRFFGEAEINLRDFDAQLVDLPETATTCSALLTAENEAGRQVTGKVSFALWLSPIRWWDAPLEQLKLPEDDASGYRTSLWLPSDLPRPFPIILHTPKATLYEEPLVTFLYLKIVKLRSQRAGKTSRKAETPKRQALQGADSRRAAMIMKQAASKKIATAKSRLRHVRSTAQGAADGGLSMASDMSFASGFDFSLDDIHTGDDIDLSTPREGHKIRSALASPAKQGGGDDGDTEDAAGLELEVYEMMVSMRNVSKRFRFRGTKNLEDFATINASIVFPIANHLNENEKIRVQIRRRRGRRLVADATIGVQALLDSTQRVSGFGSFDPTVLTWRLDGIWPGSDQAFGEALLEYGASNSDHRGGLASPDSEAPDLTLYGRGFESEKQMRLSGSMRAEPASSIVDLPSRMSWLPFSQGAKSADEPGAEPKRSAVVGPMGFVKLVIHGLSLPAVQDCYFLLRTSNYWIRSRRANLNPQPSWENMGFVLPLWVADEKVIFAVFSNSVGIGRNTPTLIGKFQYRISSMSHGSEITADFPLTMEGSGSGSARITVGWTYRTVGSLLRSYVKPRHPDHFYYLGIHEILPDTEKQLSKIVMEWLSSAPSPSVPLLVTRKAMETERDTFEFKTAQRHWNRIMILISGIKAGAAAFNRLCMWEVPWQSLLANIGCIWFVYYPHVVGGLGALAGGLYCVSSYFKREGLGSAVAANSSSAATEDAANQQSKKDDGLSDTESMGIFDKYNKMMEIALLVQNILDDIASGAERLQALWNWRDPMSTLLVCSILLLAGPLIYLVGVRPLLSFGLCFMLRHPIFQEPVQPPPAVFFLQLPTRAHALLAADVEPVPSTGPQAASQEEGQSPQGQPTPATPQADTDTSHSLLAIP